MRVTAITRKPDGAITVETVPLAPSLEDGHARDAKDVVQERIARM
jgi:hypothetical protein